MPSFTVDGSAMLADFIIPMTEMMARELFNLAEESETGNATMAIYYPVINRETLKSHKGKMVVSLTIDSGYNMVHTYEYRPRLDGKATVVHHTETVVYD